MMTEQQHFAVKLALAAYQQPNGNGVHMQGAKCEKGCCLNLTLAITAGPIDVAATLSTEEAVRLAMAILGVVEGLEKDG